MNRAWSMWPAWIGAAVVWMPAACTPSDPCGDASTCVSLNVDSVFIHTIDQLTLDLVYNGTHATTMTGMSGEARSLPVTTAVIFDVPGDPLIKLELVAAGKLGGSVLALGGGSTTIQPGNHETLDLDLMPVDPCTEGALYCGGIGDVLADGESLYRCTGGFVQFYARCMHGCYPHYEPGAVCVGGGLCSDGGTYCGGDLVDGDPGTLYVCHQFEGTVLTRCPTACVVRGGGNDGCE